MKNNPLVSICIPSYNSGLFIKETISSVLSQDHKNIEVIVSDDLSKDNTIEIINSFNDPRIKLYQNEINVGVEKNWNRTLELATGKYAKVMGADDILMPNCIKRQVEVMEDVRNQDVVLVTSHKYVINGVGDTVITIRFPGHGKIDGLRSLRMSIRRGTNIIGEPVAGLFRLESIRRSGMFDAKNLYMIDLDLWSRLLALGNLFVVDEVLYSFRISQGSLSSQIGLGQFQSFTKFCKKLFDAKIYGITKKDLIISYFTAFVKVIVRKLFLLALHFDKK